MIPIVYAAAPISKRNRFCETCFDFVVSKMFLLDGPESMREWDKFASRVDRMVQEALSASVRKSLQELARAINGVPSPPAPLRPLHIALHTEQRRTVCEAAAALTMNLQHRAGQGAFVVCDRGRGGDL
jgi:hypothetical protein